MSELKEQLEALREASEAALATAVRSAQEDHERVLALGPGGLAQLHGGRISAVDGSSRLGVARIPGVRLLDALRLVRLDRLLARYRPLLDPDAPERGRRFDDRRPRGRESAERAFSVAEMRAAARAHPPNSCIPSSAETKRKSASTSRIGATAVAVFDAMLATLHSAG